MRTLGKVLFFVSGTVWLLWFLAWKGHAMLVSSVPGCRTGAKGFPINCGWATEWIDLLSVVGFSLGLLLLLAIPCFVLGALLWAISFLIVPKGSPITPNPALHTDAERPQSAGERER